MFKKLALATLLALWSSIAWAQNPTCPTRANGDSTNACASTAFVQNAFAGGTLPALPNNQFFIGGVDGLAHAQTLSQDCTSTNAGVITCLKTNNVAFGPFATSTDAKNNIANFNSGTNASATTFWRGDGAWTNLVGLPIASGCVTMYPPSNLTGAWNVADAYGNVVSTSGTTTQGLQEAINASKAKGQCLKVYGQGMLPIFSGSGTTTNTSPTVTGLSSTTGMLAGDYVTALGGTGIQSFTQILTVDSSTQITLNKNANASGSRTIVVTRAAGANLNNFISATSGVTIPALEQWSADFYDVNITFAPAVNGPGLQFNSCMICHFGFYGGQIVYNPTTPGVNSYAILFKPTDPVPADGLITVTGSDFFFANVAAPAGSGSNVAVLALDCTNGSIISNRFGGNELNGTGTGASPSTSVGIQLQNASVTSSCAQNHFFFSDIHLVSSAAIQEGLNATNQTHYGNIFNIATIHPGSAASCYSTFGTGSKFKAMCSNDEAGGNITQGINLQAGSAQITYDVNIVGATTPFLDGGTNNSGFLNGVLRVGGTPIQQMLTYAVGGAFPQATTLFLGPAGAQSTEILGQTICPLTGTFRNLRILSGTIGGSAQTLTATVRVNGAGTSLTCAISTGSTTCSDAAHTAACTAGQPYDIQLVSSATTGSISFVTGGMTFSSP